MAESKRSDIVKSIVKKHRTVTVGREDSDDLPTIHYIEVKICP